MLQHVVEGGDEPTGRQPGAMRARLGGRHDHLEEAEVRALLMDLLAGQGKTDQAIEALRPNAATGDDSVAVRLAELLVGQSLVTRLVLRVCAAVRDN
jgi:hypothetical protein